MFTSQALLRQIPEQFRDPTKFYVSGNNIYPVGGKGVVGQLEPVAQAVSTLNSVMQVLPAIGAVASVVNLGVSVASFVYMRGQFEKLNKRLDAIDQKVDVMDGKLDVLVSAVHVLDQKIEITNQRVAGVGTMLATLAERVDRRHRNEVFAEIGAVFDALAYADRKSPAEALSIISGNLIPARKATRLYSSLVDEYASSLSPGDPGHVEVFRMRLLGTVLGIKLDLALGERDAAMELARQCAEESNELGNSLLSTWLDRYPLKGWVDSPSELTPLLEDMAGIDGITPIDRLATAFLEVQDTRQIVNQRERRLVEMLQKTALPPVMWGFDKLKDEQLAEGNRIERIISIGHVRNALRELGTASQLHLEPTPIGVKQAFFALGALLGVARGMLVETAMIQSGEVEPAALLPEGQQPFTTPFYLVRGEAEPVMAASV